MREELTLADCEERAKNPVAVSVSAIISESYRLTAKHWGPLFISLLIVLGIEAVMNLIPIIGQLATLVLQPMLGVGVIAFYRQTIKGQETSYSNIFKHTNSLLPLFLIYLLYIIYIVFGTILLVLPGIYALLVYHAAIYINGMSNNTIGVWDSLRYSRRIYNHYIGAGLGLIVTIFFLNLLGALALGIGLLFTVPMSYVIYALFLEKTLLPANVQDSLIQSIGAESDPGNGYRQVETTFDSLT